MEPDIVEIRPGVYSVLLNGQSFVIHESLSSEWIAVNSMEWLRVLADPRARSKSGGSAGSAAREVKAAMPGKVVRVLAQAEMAAAASARSSASEALAARDAALAAREALVSTGA